MTDELRIQELAEEALSSEHTPEEVCREFPGRLPQVRERLALVREVDEELDLLLPEGGPERFARLDESAEPLPTIPGYEVMGLLGRGGMGVVYRAHHLRLDRDVALKMLLAGEFASRRELERFFLEAQAIANLRHPNIVQVHDVSEREGRPYFTMELVEGGTLAQRLEGTPQPADKAAELVGCLAGAVDVAHKNGIIHRDLKPANVLLTPDGTPKVTDFGLARRVSGGDDLTASGTILGTPSYMAPEQIRGSPVGPAADVYALGAILYEILTGRPPFRSDSALATQMQVLSTDPVQPSLLNGRVPRDLETICLSCLHKEPARRYESAAELAADLRRFDLPHIPLIHDMAFTQAFIVVPDFPVTFQPELSHTTFPWLWDERRDSRIGLLPRNGDASRIQWFEAPRCFAFHFANAYDDGDLTIIDLPRHRRMFLTDQNGPNEGVPILVRWTLHRPSGRLTESVLDDRGNEFPRINGRLGGQAYRYLYTAHWGEDVAFGPAMKHDLQRGTTEVHQYGAGRMTSEPVFVRKPGAIAEDEGWILSYVYDPGRNLSDVVILDAQDFTGDPIATIRLPVRVPFGFHGGWAPDGKAASVVA